jgi:hypothetical protein
VDESHRSRVGIVVHVHQRQFVQQGAVRTYTHSSKDTGMVIVTMRNGKLHSSEFSIRKAIERNPLITQVLYSKMHLPAS